MHLTAISPHTQNLQAGHLIVDEEFYYEFVKEFANSYDFHVCKTSKDYLEQKFGADSSVVGHEPYRRGITAGLKYLSKLKFVDGQHIIFFGYCELLVALLLTFLYSRRTTQVTLVATNNIGPGRLRRAPILFRTFYFLCSWRRVNIVLHTEAEKSLLAKVHPNYRGRVAVKKHHLMTPRYSVISHDILRRKYLRIGFVGPSKPEKPLESVIEFLARLKSAGHEIRFSGLSATDHQALMMSDLNLQLEAWDDNYLTELQYRQFIAGLDAIALTHTEDFSGKLSGNLCDAISHGKIVISRGLEPIKTIEKTYGSIGPNTTFECSDAVRVLADLDHQRKTYLTGLARVGQAHSKDNIDRDLGALLNLGSLDQNTVDHKP